YKRQINRCFLKPYVRNIVHISVTPSLHNELTIQQNTKYTNKLSSEQERKEGEAAGKMMTMPA
ncbi:hypothetical protein, partial [Escherichia coli]|uniref:hypothetical protein n=1 Tax=Escherichia coli TaxID=562 RepID=UPI0032B478A2